jgi:hypothetical protein
MMCVCLSRQCTMRNSPNTSYSSFQSGLFTLFIIGKLFPAQSTQVSESDVLTIMHQLGPISTSLALDDARRASLAKSYTFYPCLIISISVFAREDEFAHHLFLAPNLQPHSVFAHPEFDRSSPPDGNTGHNTVCLPGFQCADPRPVSRCHGKCTPF